MQTFLSLHCLISFAASQVTDEDSLGYNSNLPPPLLNVTDNECSRNEECLPQESCKYFQEEVTRLEELPKGTEEYQELVANMQKLVCNKEEKGFCCSLIETNGIIGGPAEKCCRSPFEITFILVFSSSSSYSLCCRECRYIYLDFLFLIFLLFNFMFQRLQIPPKEEEVCELAHWQMLPL